VVCVELSLTSDDQLQRCTVRRMASILDAWGWCMANGESYLVVSGVLVPHVFLQTGEIDIIEGVHDNEHNQVTWHTNPGDSLMYSCPWKDTDVILGCNLTPSSNFTGTITVSGLSTPSATFVTGIRNKTTNRISTVRAAPPCLDVVSLSGVEHRTGPRSMPKAEVCLQ
jgi:hypothetical protein